MVNDIIQGPVPLLGRGYTYRPSGLFQPGEYSRLLNADLTDDGRIVNRPGTIGVRITSGVLPGTLHDYVKHMGTVLGYPLFSTSLTQTVLSMIYPPPFVDVDNDAPSDPIDLHYDDAGLPTTGVFAGKRLEGFFIYNEKMHIILSQQTSSGGGGLDKTYTVSIVASPTNFTYLGSFASASNWGGLTSALSPDVVATYQWSEAGTRGSYNDYSAQLLFDTGDYFIHKDRLWLFVGDTVYFSAATDPTNFTVPSGGFFKPRPGSLIKSMVAYNDGVYVIYDTSVHIITYSTDPNLDSEVVLVSNNMGGDDAILVGGTLYLIKDETLYQISGLSINKVLDLELGILNKRNQSQGDGRIDVKLSYYQDSLLILFRRVEGAKLATNYLPLYDDPSDGVGPLFRVSLTNGSVSEYSIGHNRPVDIFNTDSENDLNINAVYIVDYYDEGEYTYHSLMPDVSVPTSEGGYTRDFFCDTYYDPVSGWMKYRVPEVDIRIPTVVPDGLRYFMKKFRNILIQADVPTYGETYGFSLKINPDLHSSAVEGSYILERDMSEYTADVGNRKGSSPYRYPINQRSKEIGIRFYTDSEDTDIEIHKSEYEQFGSACFEISDIRTLWTYTARGPVGYTDNKS